MEEILARLARLEEENTGLRARLVEAEARAEASAGMGALSARAGGSPQCGGKSLREPNNEPIEPSFGMVEK